MPATKGSLLAMRMRAFEAAAYLLEPNRLHSSQHLLRLLTHTDLGSALAM